MRSEKEIEAVVQRFADGMYKLALHHGSRDQAADIVQEALIRFMNSNKTFKDDEHLKAWLYRVVLNLCVDYHRSWWQSKRVILEREEDFIIPQEEDVDYDWLLEEVRHLPAGQKTAIYLYYYEHMEVSSIAAIMKCRKNTVYSLLSRGRTLLKERIERRKAHEEELT